MDDRMYRICVGKNKWNVYISEEEGHCKACGSSEGYKVIITISFSSRPDSFLKELYNEEDISG